MVEMAVMESVVSVVMEGVVTGVKKAMAEMPSSYRFTFEVWRN